MRLATLREGGPDGTLALVGGNLEAIRPVPEIAPTLQAALDDWDRVEPRLRAAANALRDDPTSRPYDPDALHAPLPRAFQWLDGSAYVTHVELVRRARGATMPERFWTDPLMYQGGSDSFLAPTAPIEAADEAWGIDFEAEIAVVTGAVPQGIHADQAGDCIRLVMLVNDVSLRNLIPGELEKGFGFVQSKPSSAFSPLALTPDELGAAWDGGRLHLPLHVLLNETTIGTPNAGQDMTFDFPTLIAHAARTRPLGAGTIIGSGTVSNADGKSGSCCLAEVRMLEQLERGEPRTPFLQFGDRLRIEMFDADGRNLFGSIDQAVACSQTARPSSP